MRFAIAAIDRYLGVFETFVRNGWQPLKLFTVPLRHELSNQQAVINCAEQNKAAIQLSRMTQSDMAALRDQGCEALIVASYDWKIPDWQSYFKYAVNFHSSPLPLGRGPYPTPRAILEKWDFWAVTCHKVTPKIDEGDILAMQSFPMTHDECHESMDLKIQMAAKKLALTVATEFVPLWEKAKPQGLGDYWQKPTLSERVIDFTKPVDDLLRHIRAFGATESLVLINDCWFIVKRAVGWKEAHSYAPGSIAHIFNRSVVIAAADGYIGLLETGPAPSNIAAALQAEKNP